MKKLLISGVMALTLGLSTTAMAKEVAGKFGFGAGFNAAAGASGVPATRPTVDAIYWLSDSFGLEGTLGIGVFAPDQGDSSFGFIGGVGGIFNVASFDTTNIGLGLRVQGGIVSPPAGDSQIDVQFELPIRGEYFFSDNFSVNGSVGLAFLLDDNGAATDIRFGTAATGRLGFTFYIN
ncbi:MAG TPA: hypothetical protein RMG48_21500 [Myxococcales bacterium LLY-WYZ-16_1]|nr:hypothetical protein [Myxococcales bacterium LLY-WYZ-16_1]